MSSPPGYFIRYVGRLLAEAIAEAQDHDFHHCFSPFACAGVRWRRQMLQHQDAVARRKNE